MRAALFLFSFAVPILLPSQPQAGQALDQVATKQFHQLLVQDGVYVFIGPQVAESLITHRVDPVFPPGNSILRASGTVIVAFELTNRGKVLHAVAVSGPKILQGPVLDAFKHWAFRPYRIDGKPTTVAASIRLTVSNLKP